jgi:N-acetylmuramoyl-L-alanine amidase
MTRRSETTHILIHCSATKPQMDIGRREIREWHIAKGWVDIGYSAVIRRNGLLEFGRHFDDIGAHVAGYNSVSVGVCLVGGLYTDGTEAEDDFPGLFTPAQDHALVDLLQVLLAAYPSAKILGHRDLSPDKNKDGKISKQEWLKSCPGFDVATWCKLKGLM